MKTEKKLIVVNPKLCIGCKSCEIACAVEHSKSKDIYYASLETPSPIQRIRVLLKDSYNMPVRCQHCPDPPCLAVCPTKAIFQTPEGFVLINDSLCTGCGLCVDACPVGAIQMHPELKIAVKCDFCVDRVRAGLLPACVEACPTGALQFGTLDELRSKARAPTRTKFEETISPNTLREMYKTVGWV
ncbi:MAG: 4Fe-4S dicluster domain-containing protein [Thermofilum sp.]|jgi:carbon-monoxide dehydrogenase iron sulfur subunit|nr:4Fe-4S dicluster domain-containing protein [Thermofilum sp.]